MLIVIRASHSEIYNNVHKGVYVSFPDLLGLYNLVTGSKPMMGKLMKIQKDKQSELDNLDNLLSLPSLNDSEGGKTNGSDDKESGNDDDDDDSQMFDREARRMLDNEVSLSSSSICLASEMMSSSIPGLQMM
jgi:hypothetical protein